MRVLRLAGAGVVLACVAAASPASAQFFMQSHDVTGHPIHGDEPGMIAPMPGATATERRAGLTWTLRAALNVAALQCQFEPTLLTVDTYNALLKDHSAELKTSFDTVSKYYTRTAKTKAAGQTGLDQFGTRTYAGFATVSAQYGFCQTAGLIGRQALFTPRGKLGDLAEERMLELRNSLVPWGEQRFAGYYAPTLPPPAALPRMDAICWDKKGEWVTKKCGAQNFPPAGTGVATR